MEQSLDEVLDIITYNAAISAYEKCSKRQQALVSLAKARGVGLPLHVIPTLEQAMVLTSSGLIDCKFYFFAHPLDEGVRRQSSQNRHLVEFANWDYVLPRYQQLRG